MKLCIRALCTVCAFLTSTLHAAPPAKTISLDPNVLGKAPITTWPTFNGDYSGQRYSTLTQIAPTNVDQLTQQWVFKISDIGAQRGAPVPVIKCTPLLVDGVLYITIPDHVWAIDARTGSPLWRYDWVDHGGHLVGQRGVAIWKSTVFFLTPDNWLVALDANTGQELWRKNYADARKQYFSTSAPLIVKNHVIVGVGGDAMDMPGFLDSFDPGDRRSAMDLVVDSAQRRSGAEDLAQRSRIGARRRHDLDARHLRPRELNLLYWPTGNTNPVFAGQGRPGANLWTEAIVALDADTGKLKWYFQVSPHDTHDFDNTTAPILFDRPRGRQARKAAGPGRAQRILRHPRPRHRQIPRRQALCAAGLFLRLVAATASQFPFPTRTRLSAAPSTS